MKRAVIVLPTYNEASSIEQVLTAIKNVTKPIEDWEVHMLVVDSASPDGTSKLVEHIQSSEKNVHLLKTKKEGLGKAYIEGFTEAIDNLKAEVIFEMDSDMSHDPSKIPLFLNEIDNGAQFVIGSRYINGGSIPSDWGFHRKVFSFIGNLIIRFGFMHLKLTDWTSGYRAIKADLVKKIMGKVDNFTGYVFQVALLDNAVKEKAIIREVPFHFVDRKDGVSKINSVEYIIQTLWYVFFESSFIKFVIVGGTGFIIDSVILSLLVLDFHMYPTWAKLISAEAAIINNFTLNNYWSFSHKKLDMTVANYFKGLLKFNLVSSGNILIQTIGITLMTHYFGKDLIVLFNALIIFVFVIPYSYFFYNKFIWKDSKPSEEPPPAM